MRVVTEYVIYTQGTTSIFIREVTFSSSWTCQGCLPFGMADVQCTNVLICCSLG